MTDVSIWESREDLVHKHKILQNDKKVRNTEIHIYEDVSKDTMTLRKSLWEEVLNYHCQGKFAYLNILSYII